MTGWCPLLAPPPRVSCCGSPYCLWKDELACDRREPSLLWVSAPPMFGLELGFARRLLPTMLIFSSPTGTCGADETPRRGPLLLGRCMLGARTARSVPGRSALLARGRTQGHGEPRDRHKPSDPQTSHTWFSFLAFVGVAAVTRAGWLVWPILVLRGCTYRTVDEGFWSRLGSGCVGRLGYATNSSGEFHSPGMCADACQSLCQSMQRRSSTPVRSSTVRSRPSSRRSAAAKSCASTWEWVAEWRHLRCREQGRCDLCTTVPRLSPGSGRR